MSEDAERLATTRKQLGLSIIDAYQGTYGKVPTDDHRSVRMRWRDFETGRRVIPPVVLRCMVLTWHYWKSYNRLPPWVSKTEVDDG